MEQSQIAQKFVRHDIRPLEHWQGTTIYKLKVKVLNGEKLTNAEKDLILRQCEHGRYAGVKFRGWYFSFAQIMKRFWVKFKYGDIRELYAPDEDTLLRSRWIYDVIEIHEVPRRQDVE